MLGAIILAVVIVFLLPSAVLISGGLASAFVGWALKDEAERNHEGSELIDLNT